MDYAVVRIFLVSSTHAKGKVKYAAVMWLVEYVTSQKIPVTRQGTVCGNNTTQLELTLEAFIEVLSRLKKPCSILLYTDCEILYNALNLGRLSVWEKAGWKNGSTLRKHASAWASVYEKLEPHIIAVRNARHDYTGRMEYDIGKELEKWESKSGPT